jgi:hypothetical protein
MMSGEVDAWIHVFLTSALAGWEWSASRPGSFTPGENVPVSHSIWDGGGGGAWKQIEIFWRSKRDIRGSFSLLAMGKHKTREKLIKWARLNIVNSAVSTKPFWYRAQCRNGSTSALNGSSDSAFENLFWTINRIGSCEMWPQTRQGRRHDYHAA